MELSLYFRLTFIDYIDIKIHNWKNITNLKNIKVIVTVVASYSVDPAENDVE